MPRINIKFFGPARELAGETELSLEVPRNITVGGVAGILAENYPQLGDALGIRLAVNKEYCALDRVLRENDEVAVIPPVSGGGTMPRVQLIREPIDMSPLMVEMRTDGCGAVSTFDGVVRAESSEGRNLSALDYEAYEEMALEQLAAIRRRAGEKFDIVDAAIVHRLGRVPIGEPSVSVVVVSAHRKDGLDAVRYIIDTLKVDVPIWKKEIWSDGQKSWGHNTI